MIERPSPNHDSREGQKIDILLLHYTGMRSADEALNRLCDPHAEPGRVSAHYCIDEDGTVYRLVTENRRAWHAGVASWAGASDINARSVGIELVNPGHEFGYRPFPDAQMQALVALARAVVARHRIPSQRVLGHSDVAPLRKEDPGELFDWRGLAAAGVGLWPTQVEPLEQTADTAEVQALLADYGYAIERHGRHDAESRRIVQAFQRHFRPTKIDGAIDGETVAILRALLRESRESTS